METVIVRPMTIADHEAVYALWMDTPGMGCNTLDDSREGIARFLHRNPMTCFVAVNAGTVDGTILCGHDGRRGHIYHTAVRASLRGRGIGRMLVARALDALKREGIAKVSLVVFGRNETGNAFWEKQGFSVRNDLVYRDKSILAFTRIDT